MQVEFLILQANIVEYCQTHLPSVFALGRNEASCVHLFLQDVNLVVDFFCQNTTFLTKFKILAS